MPREAGEETRERLVDAGLFDGDRQIVVEDGEIYVPVADADAVPADLTVVDRATGGRDEQTTPADLLEEPPTYERLGDIVIIDEDDPERARAVADAIVASDVPCETVLNRASKVTGKYRVREWERLAGESTETVHREYGHEFLLDPTVVYFSPRLATERHRVVEQVQPGERVLDMFAGVGPFAVPAASRGGEVVAVDVNPAAIPYLRTNADRNGVADRLTAVGADIRRVVGANAGEENDVGGEDDTVDGSDAPDGADTADVGDTVDGADTADVGDTVDGADTADCGGADGYRGWADRLVANLPHSADEFLDTAVALAGDDCVLHYYDIQHEDDPFGPGTQAIRAAVTASEDDYAVTVETERVVRSYAPHELNVCLDVRLRR